MLVLGIETSCDETAVGIVDHNKTIHSNIIFSQIKEHEAYFGVVPEIASRSHLRTLEPMVKKALKEGNFSVNDIDAIAVTAGPGLIGGLIVGVMFAKGLALAYNKPLIAVNHLEGHALTCRLTHDLEFPYLLLSVSGGHCQIIEVFGVANYKLLGHTIDDAAGEAFDKVAKMLGLGYPGGVEVEKKAAFGNIKAFDLPLPLVNEPNCNFSFSGLKTAVKRIVEKHEMLSEQFICDMAASFQDAVARVLVKKLTKAMKLHDENGKRLVISGGVAANKHIGKALQNMASEQGYQLFIPPIKLCTDNGAMIAWAGLERLRLGLIDDLKFEPRSRWPITELKVIT